MRAKSIIYYYAAIFAWMAMGYPVLSAFAQTPNLATVARLTSVSCCQACAVGLAIMATLHTKQYQRYWAALEAVYIYGWVVRGTWLPPASSHNLTGLFAAPSYSNTNLLL